MREEDYPIIHGVICSNMNRVAIMHLLRNLPENELQVEKIATNLGISHRTAIYHLEILEECGVVEVRDFKTKGLSNVRSVWGIDSQNTDHVAKVFDKIYSYFPEDELDKHIQVNMKPR